MKRHIVILGGGFGGVKCAQTLRRGLPRDCAELVLLPILAVSKIQRVGIGNFGAP